MNLQPPKIFDGELMKRVDFTSRYVKAPVKLPQDQEEKLARLVEILRKDQFHYLLHTKQLTGKMPSYYSFRVSRDWRAIFHFIGDEVVELTDVAHRKDVYR